MFTLNNVHLKATNRALVASNKFSSGDGTWLVIRLCCFAHSVKVTLLEKCLIVSCLVIIRILVNL